MPSPTQQSRVSRFRARSKPYLDSLRKSRLRRMTLEGLEARTLLATLPAALVSGQVNVSSTGGTDESSPSVAIDPINPLKVVSVFTTHTVNPDGSITIILGGDYSTNGGRTWTSLGLPGSNLFDPTTSNPVRPYTTGGTDATVAFDRSENFYIVQSQSSSTANGAIVLHKFSFTNNAPTATFTNKVLYQTTVDGALTPMLAVDNNLGVFTDPTTNAVQTDAHAGTVYVAFATNDVSPIRVLPVGSPYTPNVVRLMASQDGGVDFTPPMTMSDGNTGNNPDGAHTGNTHNVMPRLVVSQGRLANTAVYGPGDQGVPGGQVTVVWDDTNTGSQANPPFDVLWSDRVINGGEGFQFTANNFGTAGNPGPNSGVGTVAGQPAVFTGPVILDAVDPGNSQPHLTATTNFPLGVNITDPNFILDHLTVKLNMTEPNLAEIEAELIAPDGTSVILFLNETNASGNTPNNPGFGISGADLGTTTSGIRLGTTFDQQAARDIVDVDPFNNNARGATAPFAGVFRPEDSFQAGGAANSLDNFNGMTAAQINSGAWTLRILDFRSDGTQTPAPQLVNWSLDFGGALNPGLDRQVSTTLVRGSLTVPYPTASAASPIGIGPGVSIAADNTLGSFSPHEGRIYVAYVGRYNTLNNPADNTDIFLVASDDGGLSWNVLGNSPVQVNQDNATTDGFSEGAGTLTGRPQFEPSLAVDQATGTLVATYLDTRNDPARARTATYLTTSIDGGNTFSPEVFLNPQKTATDAITGQQLVIGPVPDNESAGNPFREGTFGFGQHQGLAVFNGQVIPVWASNRNLGNANILTTKLLLDIFSARTNIAAGPRIISSTMGPVGQPGDPLNTTRDPNDNTPQASTFQVLFDRPIDQGTFSNADVHVYYHNPNGADPFISVPVTNVVALLNPNDPRDDKFGRTLFQVSFTPQSGAGTYSYVVGPDIRDRIRSTVLTQPAAPIINQGSGPLNLTVPPAGSGGSGTANDTLTSTISLAGHPAQLVTGVTITLNMSHTRDGDLTITLVAPNGATSTLYSKPTDNGANFTGTTFSDQAGVSILNASAAYSGTFQPVTPLSALNGSLVDGNWQLVITDGSTGNVGQLINWSLSINSAAPTSAFQNGAFMDQNANGTTQEEPSVNAANNTAFVGDAYAAPRPLNPIGPYPAGTPIFGTFFAGPYSSDTLPLIVPGPTVLSTHVAGNPPSGDNLVLNNTVAGLDVTFDRPMQAGSFGPLSVQRIIGPTGLVTEPVDITSSDVGKAIPDNAATPLVSTITVPDDGGVFKVADLNVQLGITHPRDSDLTVALIAPDGTQIQLFAAVGGAGQNFSNTTFSDQSPVPVGSASAPFNGIFRPAQPLSTFVGKELRGTWKLKVTDNNPGPAGAATLNSWTLIAAATTARPVYNSGDVPKAIPDATSLINPGVVTSTIVVPNDGSRFVINDLDVQFNITHPHDADLTVTLIDPTGTPHILFNGVGGPLGQNFNDTILDDEAGVPITDATAQPPYNGSFQTPTQALAALNGMALQGTWTLKVVDNNPGPAGGATLNSWSLLATPQPIAAPAPFASAGSVAIADSSTTDATIVVPNDGGRLIISDLNVTMNITHPRDSDLQAILIAPDGTQIKLFTNVGGAGQNFTGTTFDDQAATAIGAGSAPFSGSFIPKDHLSLLNGKAMQGTWTLRLIDTAAGPGAAATLNSWSLSMAPTSALASTYRITMPRQQLSGTYTITLAANLQDQRGIQLNTSLNAGLDVERGVSAVTTTVKANSVNVPLPIPDATTPSPGVVSPGVVQSTITVTDDFTINGITLQLNITHPSDPDLEATLIGPDGTSVKLFTNVGNVGNLSGFSNTVFDDSATTPIQNGGPPFFGSFSPQLPFGNAFVTGRYRSAGTWTLVLQDDKANGLAGTLNSWSLTFQKPLPNTGLGQPVADQATVSYRIFTMDPTNPLSSDTWTAVGPASIGGSSGSGPETAVGGTSGRIGGIAVDPSDPSGNTVYIGGASGGIWKTTNFLNPGGPTWIPLTDFGPTFGINIGGLAVFPRNNDPNQSIIIAATGEGDTLGDSTSRGVGFLRSMDGGATWTLLDSTNNTLPFAQRDHAFAKNGGTAAFKVLVDPKLSVDGQVIIYAALSDNQNGNGEGGVWRSLDTGQTWQQMRPGQATDIVLDPNSGTGAPGGNLQVIYAAMRNDITTGQAGVFGSPNRGQVWNQLLGITGDPLIQDNITHNPIPVNNVPPGTTPFVKTAPYGPVGFKGRIVLVKPFLTGNVSQDLIYQGWLYAVAVTPDGALDGMYETKDFGQTWTKIRVPNLTLPVPNPPAIPSNNGALGDIDPFAGPAGLGFPGQGNYDVSIGIDPTNPNIIYVGGTLDGPPSGLIRVDTTLIQDAHALVPFDSAVADGGQLALNTNAAILLKDLTKAPPAPPFFNFIRDPNQPFLAGATLRVPNTALFTNTGFDARWTPFDIGGTDQHRMVTEVDPLTGHARLIIGDDQGVFTAVDNHGVFETDIGTGNVPTGSRNGNLQITQFYYGASQPSNLAAQVAGALLYGSAQDNGGPRSDPNLLSNGNISWGGPGGDATGVATDQQGVGTVYQYFWICCGPQAKATDFFQVNGVGRVFGLFQQSNPGPTPDPQWPFLGGSNFAVNPLNGQQIVMSSQAGRIFSTENQGRTWFVIGDPTGTPPALDGSYAPGLAYGAPDPNGPGGIGNLDNFVYAGTSAGHIFVTQTGGGGAGNAWADITNGDLAGNGATVWQIVTNPTRGSHEAFAVTSNGVYHIANSVSTPQTGPATTWVKITSNLFSILHNPFGNSALADPTYGLSNRLQTLRSIQADWRYVIPNPGDPVHPFPVLYVGGDGGVYRSIDGGQTWAPFPNQTFSAPLSLPLSANLLPLVDTGFLPNVKVNDLDIVLGNVDPTTGRPDVSTGPNILLASTYGRGSFGIRLAPITFPNSVQQPNILRLDATTDSGVAAIPSTLSDGITNNVQPIFDGLSEQSAFGNTVTINLIDLTDPNHPVPIPTVAGTAQTDGFGNFKVQVAPNYFMSDGSTDGVKAIGFQAVDASGTKGNIATLNFTLDTTPPVPPGTPKLDPTLPPPNGSDTGLSQVDNITNVANPVLDVLASGPNPTPTILQLLRDGVMVAFTQIPAGPVTTTTPITDPSNNAGANVVHVYSAVQEDVAGNTSVAGGQVTVTFDTVPPPNPALPTLDPNDDSGVKGDNQTNVLKPHLIGNVTFEASDPAPTTMLVEIVDATNINNVLGTAFAQANGSYSVQFTNPLVNGGHAVRIRVEDEAGNFSASPSPTLTLLINNTPPQPAPTIALKPSDDTGAQGDNITSVRQPHLIGATGSGLFVDLIDVNGNASSPAAPGKILATVTADSQGAYIIQFPAQLADGTYVVRTQARDVAGNTNLSPTLTLTIDATPPANAPTLSLLAADDSGVLGDGITNVRRPHLIGTTEPGGSVNIINAANGNILAQAVADAQGNYTAQLANNLNNGTLQLVARATDIAGNVGPTSAPFTLQIITVTGDYDGDGKADLAVFRPTTGTWFIKQSTAGGKSQQFGTNGDIPLQGDFDGDGKTDLVLFRPSTATWFVLRSSAGPQSFQFGAPNLDLPVVGDYNGDGKADFAVFRPTTDEWFVALSGGGTMHVQFGAPGLDRPEPGDYNGDGKTDFAVYRPTTHQFLIAGVGIRTIGQTGDIAVPGAYNGAATALPAVFRPSTDQWLVLPTGAANPTTTVLGQGNDIAVPGDYNGDGKTEFATFKPATGTWLIQGGGAATGFGAPNLDIPVPRALDYISLASNFVGKSAAGGPAGAPSGHSFGSNGSGSSGGGMRAASFDFGQQAASFSAGSRSAALVVVPNPASTSSGTSTSNSSTSRTASTSSSLLATSVAQRPPVTVVTSTSDEPAAPVNSSGDDETTLSAALTGLGRIKAGRLLPELGL